MAKTLRYRGFQPFALLVNGERTELKPGETVELPDGAADYHLLDGVRWEEVSAAAPVAVSSVDDESPDDKSEDDTQTDEGVEASEGEKPARKRGK